MKLLLDQNLSHRLIPILEAQFPDSAHVRAVGLGSASDAEVWEFARAGGYTLLTKDTDFRQRSFTFGAPPKVVWIALGNCTTDAVADLLLANTAVLTAFEADSEATYLALR